MHKDSIKENLYEIENSSTLDDSKRFGVVSIKLLFALMKEFLENGVDVIVEGPFSFDEDLEFFNSLIEKYNLDFYCVVCEVDQEIREKRFVERERHDAHHDGERLADNNDSDWVFVKEFDFNQMPEKKIWINTIDPIDEILEKVLSIVK